MVGNSLHHDRLEITGPNEKQFVYVFQNTKIKIFKLFVDACEWTNETKKNRRTKWTEEEKQKLKTLSRNLMVISRKFRENFGGVRDLSE